MCGQIERDVTDTQGENTVDGKRVCNNPNFTGNQF